MRKNAAGFTLLEMLFAMLTLAFVITGGTVLYVVGYHQQKVSQNYSQVQNDLRDALARADRAVRHGCEVVTSNTVYSSSIVVTQFSPPFYSNAAQLCIRAPQPSAVGGYVEIRFYLVNGTFYSERADAVGNLTTLMTNVQALTFNYFQTGGTQRTPVDNAPATATEVQITLTGQSAQPDITATAVTTVNLRNQIAASGVE